MGRWPVGENVHIFISAAERSRWRSGASYNDCSNQSERANFEAYQGWKYVHRALRDRPFEVEDVEQTNDGDYIIRLVAHG